MRWHCVILCDGWTGTDRGVCEWKDEEETCDRQFFVQWLSGFYWFQYYTDWANGTQTSKYTHPSSLLADRYVCGMIYTVKYLPFYVEPLLIILNI